MGGLLGGLLIATPALSAQIADTVQISTPQTLVTASGEELNFEVFPSTNSDAALRVFWIAPSFGIDPRHRQTAAALANQSLEVWLIDLPDALFMTKGVTSIRDIPGSLVAELITIIGKHNNDPADVLLISNTYGAIPALRGIHAWQSQTTKPARLLGAVFFSPSFFSHVPELGIAPSFIPELTTTNAPLYIFQAANNSNRWHLPAVLDELQHATVYVELLKNTMSVFYEKDRAPDSLRNFQQAPRMILRAIRQLRQHEIPPTPLAPSTEEIPLSTRAENPPPHTGLNTQLKTYTSSASPQPIRLHDTAGRLFDIQDYRGKVTLINFWASWCPPCVEEIPSLNRLKHAMKGKPFQLISINYAETAEEIRSFLKKVNVDFPVLVDPGGQLTGQWKVLAFPSTFVIGPDGNIKLGVNAAIHWDSEEVIQALDALLENKGLEKTEGYSPDESDSFAAVGNSLM